MGRREEDKLAELEASLTDEERKMLDELADGIARRRLSPLALFFLESMKPLGFVGSQVMHFFRPVVSAIWSNPVTYDQVSAVLERRGSIELLLRRIESIEDPGDVVNEPNERKPTGDDPVDRS